MRRVGHDGSVWSKSGNAKQIHIGLRRRTSNMKDSLRTPEDEDLSDIDEYSCIQSGDTHTLMRAAVILYLS